jgi:Septum formation
MRRVISRGIAGTLLAGITVLAVSACSLPPGTDGDLTNQWPAMAPPSGWEPKAGACTTEFFVQAHRTTYDPIDCTKDHRYETVFVGQFTGDAAALANPPAVGKQEMTAAWADCDAKTIEFLGGDWRDAKIWIGVSTPSPGNWSGGARWYRCEVGLREDLHGGAVGTAKSLKGEMAGESAAKYGCYQHEKDSADNVEKPCSEAHNSEYTGFVKVDYAYPDLKNHTDEFFGKCRSNIARYAGVPDDSNVKYRTGVLIDWPSPADWQAGDTNIRCYMWLGSEKKTRSIKGVGSGGLPIHYA